jgi:microcystin-dependent protein
MNAGAISPTGGSQPFSIMQPYLGMNYIIALEGIFPSRN